MFSFHVNRVRREATQFAVVATNQTRQRELLRFDWCCIDIETAEWIELPF